MKFIVGVIASVGFLVAVILGMIALDPGYLQSSESKVDGTVCTMEWAPVCGINGITYGNSCMLEASGTTLDYVGECMVEQKPIEPEPVACTKEWMPVCGVDGITYGNKCMLGAAGVTLDYEGECIIEEPAPEPEPSTAMPLPPQTHSVSIPDGVSIPGCEETSECFAPYLLSIFLGDTVSWVNNDAAAHTVTSGTIESGPTGLFDSGLFMSGSVFDFTFSEVGEYDYFCLVHPWMTGKVIVNPPAQDVVIEPEVSEPEPTPAEPAPEPATENPAGITEERRAGPPEVIMTPGSGSPGCEANLECYIPHTLMIDSGEIVVWINSDSAAHTVTSGVMPAGHDGKFDSGLIMAGNTWEHGFTESGEYDYYCMVHPWMTGKVIVS